MKWLKTTDSVLKCFHSPAGQIINYPPLGRPVATVNGQNFRYIYQSPQFLSFEQSLASELHVLLPNPAYQAHFILGLLSFSDAPTCSNLGGVACSAPAGRHYL